VNRVAKISEGLAKGNHSSIDQSQENLISKAQISVITDSLLRFASVAGQSGDRKTLESMVERTLNSAIQSWMDKSLDSIVGEVIEQEMAKLQTGRRRVG
jgi:cell pole-organizing protein PopZ